MPDLSGGQKFSFPTLFDFYREVFLITFHFSAVVARPDVHLQFRRRITVAV